MHTKFYLIPSYDVENLIDAKKLGVNSDFANHENTRSVLENKNLSDANTLALFDRNNKLSTNTKKSSNIQVEKPSNKQAETQTDNLKDIAPAKSVDNVSLDTSYQSAFSSSNNDISSSSNSNSVSSLASLNEAYDKLDEALVGVPRAYKTQASRVYRHLLEKRIIDPDPELYVTHEGQKIHVNKLMRGIFQLGGHVNSYKPFFKSVARYVPDEIIRNSKFLSLKNSTTPDKFIRGSGKQFVRKIKWINY